MTKRDPRVDPKPGDVLKKNRRTRIVVSASDGIVEYRTPNHFYHHIMGTWGTWAKNAEVIHAAE